MHFEQLQRQSSRTKKCRRQKRGTRDGGNKSRAMLTLRLPTRPDWLYSLAPCYHVITLSFSPTARSELAWRSGTSNGLMPGLAQFVRFLIENPSPLDRGIAGRCCLRL